ncbi:MAG: hypothetical protein QM703_11490 [Gemmatales bacterium]
MRFLAILTTCLFIGAATWIQGTSRVCAGMVDDKFLPDVQKIIDHILGSDQYGRSDKDTGFRELFKKVGVEGLRKLQSHPDDSIALQAAWEEVELTIPLEYDSKVYRQRHRIDSKKLEWFLGFLEKRCKVTSPDWWKQAVLGLSANKRYNVVFIGSKVNPYHESGLDFITAPLDTTLKRKADNLLLQVSGDALEFKKDGIVDSNYCGISALFTANTCFVAVHGDLGYPYQLTCFDRTTSKVVWKSKVWGSWWHSSSGPGTAFVKVTEQRNRIIVFGVATTGIHIEGFDPKDGKNLFRFSNAYRLLD